MANPAQFAVNMRVHGKRILEETARAKRVAASAALRTAVTATPVDTGRARGGWDIGIGGPGSSGENLDPTGTTAIASGLGTISGAKSPTLPIYISNTVVYIGPLENGSSRQAPSGMLTTAVNAAQAAVAALNIKI